MGDALIKKYYMDKDGDLQEFAVYRDDEPDNPRDADCNLGHLHLLWNRYSLGDNKGKDDLRDTLVELATDHVEQNKWCEDEPTNAIMIALQQADDVVIMPCRIYEHSGLTISCANFEYPFNDRFDSGWAGFIYTTKEDFEKQGLKWDKDNAKANLISEIDTYDMYLQGEVYGFVDENGDSCWGFYSEKYGDELFEEIARGSCHDFDNTKWYEESEVEEKTTVIVERTLKEGVE